jgi:hypothetical protein
VTRLLGLPQLGALRKYFPKFGERASNKVSFRMIMAGQGMSTHYDPINIIRNMLEKRRSVPVFQALKGLKNVVVKLS